MALIKELEVREVVRLYQLIEDSYGEASRLLCHGISEPVGREEKIHGLFVREDRAKQRLDSLVKQRIQEGYSRPNYVGGEQTRVEQTEENNKIFCTSIKIRSIEVDKQDLIETPKGLRYKGILVE